jgi:hypothetical protein
MAIVREALRFVSEQQLPPEQSYAEILKPYLGQMAEARRSLQSMYSRMHPALFSVVDVRGDHRQGAH